MTLPRTPRRTQFQTCSACDPSRCAQGPCHQPSAPRLFWPSWRLEGMRLRLVVGRGPFDVLAFTPTHQPEEERGGWARTSFSPDASVHPVHSGTTPAACSAVPQATSKQQLCATGRKTTTSFTRSVQMGEWLGTFQCMAVSLGRRKSTHFGFQTPPYRRHTQQAAPFGGTQHVGVMAFLIAHLFVDISILSELPQLGPSFSTARRIGSQPAGRTAHSFVGFATNAQRTRRPFHLDAPDDGPRQSFEPLWWSWRRVFATPWRSAEEHINVLELRAFLAGVACRPRNSQNVGSRGLMLMVSAVVLAAVAKARSSSRRFGPIIERVDALMIAGSFQASPGVRRVGAQPCGRAQLGALMPVRKKPCPASTSARSIGNLRNNVITPHPRQICSRL